MIITLFNWGAGFLWIALAIAITVWWRSKWIYIYFGGPNSVFNSWLATLGGSCILATILIGIIGIPIVWLMEHHLTFLPDAVAVYFTYKYFNKSEPSN